jgi:hypothetical protein
MSDPTQLPAMWYLLFPITYVIHVTEEYLGGAAGVALNGRVGGTNVSPSQFVILNSIGVSLMLVGYYIASTKGFSQWLMVMLGTVVLVNGLLHTYATIRDGRYNPGVVSGLAIWAPLGAITLFRLAPRMSSQRLTAAILTGLAVQVTVSILSLKGEKLFGT